MGSVGQRWDVEMKQKEARGRGVEVGGRGGGVGQRVGHDRATDLN